MRVIISIALIGAALGAAIVGMLGFRGRMSRKPAIFVFPDMNRQLKLRPMQPNDFFKNGVSSQLPPTGTVARGKPIQTLQGPVYGFEDSPVNTGRITGTTNFVATNPLPMDKALLERGRQRFNIYCSPCHGRLGNGNGITKKLGVMPAVANLHDQRIIDMPDGEIFNVITHGKGVMGAYGPLVPTRDRWAIIAYVRALQLSQLGTTNDLTAVEQASLMK